MPVGIMFSSLPGSPVGPPLSPTVTLLSISLPLLILSEARSFYPGSVIFKILSSLAFVTGPLLKEWAQWPPYHFFITSGLLLSLAGDVLLIPSRGHYFSLNTPLETPSDCDQTNSKSGKEEISTSFKLGMLTFAAAHGAYILAFFRSAESVSWGLFVGTFMTTMAVGKSLGVISVSKISRWDNILDLSISGEMRLLVSIYTVIISSMLAASVSTSPLVSTHSPYQAVLGAFMFVVSDIFVAQDVFGRKYPVGQSGDKIRQGRYGWQGRVVGWVFYFWGQMILAGTVGK